MEPFEEIYDVDYDPCDSDSMHGTDSSDECLQDFENEMQEELDRRVGLKRLQKKPSQSGVPSSSGRRGQSETESNPGKPTTSKSGGEDEPADQPGESNKTAAEEANDDAFYDPDEDEDNERWAQRQREINMFPEAAPRTLPLPNSDAVLNCPGCMTVLCRDCQAHETNAGQYRAMFVSNCKADMTVEVPGPLVKKRAARKRKRGGHQVGDSSSDDNMVFHPFHCDFCQTRVGVLDSDEVYHFLNVLAS